jgi:hypothetical protein
MQLVCDVVLSFAVNSIEAAAVRTQNGSSSILLMKDNNGDSYRCFVLFLEEYKTGSTKSYPFTVSFIPLHYFSLIVYSLRFGKRRRFG